MPTNRPSHTSPFPSMNWALIALTLAAYLLQTLRPALMPRCMLDADALQLWQFLTYAFLHLSPLHLLGNMLVLAILGPPINQRLTHPGYLAFYLASTVFAAVGFLVAGGEMMVGASGAVGAVMGAHLAFLPKSRLRIPLGFLSLHLRTMNVILTFFLYNLLMSLIDRTAVQQIAYQAHIAGMLFGFTLALTLLHLSLIPNVPLDLLSDF